jgi:hypothetical protein
MLADESSLSSSLSLSDSRLPLKEQFTTKNTRRTKKNTNKNNGPQGGLWYQGVHLEGALPNFPILLNPFVFFALFVVQLPNFGLRQ